MGAEILPILTATFAANLFKCSHLYFTQARSVIDEDDADPAYSKANNPLTYWKIEALLVAFECAERLPHYRLKKAFDVGLRLLECFRMTYGDWRPCVSVLCFRLAAIAADLLATADSGHDRRKLYQLIEDARERLITTHGSQHCLSRRAEQFSRQHRALYSQN